LRGKTTFDFNLQRKALTWNPRNFLKAALSAAFKKFLVLLKAIA
jgi:hypothetical protein